MKSILKATHVCPTPSYPSNSPCELLVGGIWHTCWPILCAFEATRPRETDSEDPAVPCPGADSFALTLLWASSLALLAVA